MRVITWSVKELQETIPNAMWTLLSAQLNFLSAWLVLSAAMMDSCGARFAEHTMWYSASPDGSVNSAQDILPHVSSV